MCVQTRHLVVDDSPERVTVLNITCFCITEHIGVNTSTIAGDSGMYVFLVGGSFNRYPLLGRFRKKLSKVVMPNLLKCSIVYCDAKQA